MSNTIFEIFTFSPQHPMFVHFPLALIWISLLLAVLIIVGIKKWNWQKSVWGLLVVLYGVQVMTTYISMKLGENEEDKVEKIVGENNFEAHEEAAEQFMFFTLFLFALSFAPLFFKKQETAWVSLVLIANLLGAFISIGVGHSGGKLVYRYNAASAYQK